MRERTGVTHIRVEAGGRAGRRRQLERPAIAVRCPSLLPQCQARPQHLQLAPQVGHRRVLARQEAPALGDLPVELRNFECRARRHRASATPCRVALNGPCAVRWYREASIRVPAVPGHLRERRRGVHGPPVCLRRRPVDRPISSRFRAHLRGQHAATAGGESSRDAAATLRGRSCNLNLEQREVLLQLRHLPLLLL